jgi:fucose permease
MLSLAVSIGGLLLPMMTAAAAALVSWKVVVIGGGVWSAVIAVAGLAVIAPRAHVGATSWGSLRGFLRQRGFFHFCLLVACGAANEGAFAGWTSSYLTAAGFSAVAATWGLSSHWLGLLIGRSALAGRVDRGKRAAIIRAALAGGACLLLMIVWPIRPVLALGPFAGGVAIAVIVPTALAFAGERHRGNSGMLFGVLLTMAQIGAMVLPPLVGALADVTSLRVGLLVAVANAGLIAGLAWDVGRHQPAS